MTKHLALIGILIVSASAPAKEIALTFDDAPRYGTQRFNGVDRARHLVQSLKTAQVKQVAFFANSGSMDDQGEEGRKRLEFYASHGHLIGNHTHGHPDINVTSLAAYLENIRRADRELSSLPNFWKAFRFPFLREGNDSEKRDGARKELAALGYLNAYITVNNYDWEMDRLLQAALKAGRTVDYKKLREVYLEVLLGCLEFYDSLAVEYLGRSPKQIFLLHENDLNALFVGDLVKAMEARGWKIISPVEAYKDEIASRETKTLFPRNPGRIGEIAKDSGYEGRLWDKTCNEEYLAKLFSDRQVFQ